MEITFTEIAVILSLVVLLTIGKPVLLLIVDWILGE